MKNVFKVLLSALMVVTLFVGCEDVLPTNDISAVKDVNLSKDLEFYAIKVLHNSDTLSSSDNSVLLLKMSRVEGKTITDIIETFGTFVSQPSMYTLRDGSRTESNTPEIGYDVNELYKGTLYEGHSEVLVYASLTIEEMMDKVQEDISNNISVKLASNYSGSLANSGNFWTYVTFKQGLYDRLAEISNQ